MYVLVGRVDEARSVVTRDFITFLGTRKYRVVGPSAVVVEYRTMYRLRTPRKPNAEKEPGD